MSQAHTHAQRDKTLNQFWTTLHQGFFCQWLDQKTEAAGFEQEPVTEPATAKRRQRKKQKTRVAVVFDTEALWIADHKKVS